MPAMPQSDPIKAAGRQAHVADRERVQKSLVQGQSPPWHALSIEQCLHRLGVTADGLSSGEARARLGLFGPNEIPGQRRYPLPILFLRQFRSPLIYLLLGAVAISIAIGRGSDAIFIAAVLVINATIGGIQEYRAETSMSALQKLIRETARVRRDGAIRVIDARELVIGDVIEVESGMAIAGDARLLWSSGLLADESTFSGESLPTAKEAATVVSASAGLGDRPTLLHAGTTIAEGRGVGVVVATGSTTALGSISASLFSSADTPPPLMARLNRLARQIALATVFLIATLALLLNARGQPAAEILLLAVALSVSAIPEGLTVAVTVALTAATRRMAARQVIVRALPAVEGLGACTLIASDKTGTLTQNRLSAERVVLPSGEVLEPDQWLSPDYGEAVSRLAWAVAYCNEAWVAPDGAAFGDSVDVALAAFAETAGIDFKGVAGTPRMAAMRYEPARKFATVVVERDGGPYFYMKGAPEILFQVCGEKAHPVFARVEDLAAAGYRIIAVAGTPLPADGEVSTAIPDRLELLGCIGLLDPIRPEARAAIAKCADAGIKVLMVTGDHPGTALTVARQLGLAEAEDEVVTGAAIAAAQDDPGHLAALVGRGRVFARIEPMQKLRIVEVLTAAGELVAVTGDGVNDAPALQAASIGIAMGRGGTDVARGAADLVLADDNFASIVAGVEEGRITYANVRKIVIFLLATGVAEIAMFIGAVAMGLPMPLRPVQLLWCNLVTNGAQDVMLGFGRGEGDELRHPPRPVREPIVDGTAIALIVPPALVMSVVALLLAGWGIERGAPIADVRNGVLLLTVLFQNAYVLCMQSERNPAHRQALGDNPWLLAGVGLALTLHMVAMYWPPLRSVLGTGPVDDGVLAICLGGIASVILTTEVTKYIVRAWASERKIHPNPPG